MATIIKRGDSYLIQVSVSDGKGGYTRKSTTYRPPAGATPTQAIRGAQKFANEFEQRCKGLTSYDDNMTLDELHEWYMTNIAPNRLKKSTAEVNTQYYNCYIKPILGKYRLKQLLPGMLDNAFKQIQLRGATKEYYSLTDANAYVLQYELLVAHIARWRLWGLSAPVA